MGCCNSAIINASAEEVWQTIRKFNDFSWSKNVIQSCECDDSGSGNTIGSKRVLNGGIYETLVAHDDGGKTFSYSIDDGPDVLSKDTLNGYIGKVTVYPVTENNSAFVLWTSSWSSSTKEGVADFCNPIYHALLQDLKSNFS